VLWSYAWKESVFFSQYDISSAYMSRGECESEMVNTTAKSLKSLKYEVQGDFQGSRELLAQRGDNHWRFFCLPDTWTREGRRGSEAMPGSDPVDPERIQDFLEYWTGDPVPMTGRWRASCCEWPWTMTKGEPFPPCLAHRRPVAWTFIRTQTEPSIPKFS
jgi:hypothetical protein